MDFLYNQIGSHAKKSLSFHSKMETKLTCASQEDIIAQLHKIVLTTSSPKHEDEHQRESSGTGCPCQDSYGIECQRREVRELISIPCLYVPVTDTWGAVLRGERSSLRKWISEVKESLMRDVGYGRYKTQHRRRRGGPRGGFKKRRHTKQRLRGDV